MLKEKFKKIVEEKIQIDGIHNLMDYLENDTDFFTAPASSKFHSNHEGGLVEHSLYVYENLKKKKQTYLVTARRQLLLFLCSTTSVRPIIMSRIQEMSRMLPDSGRKFLTIARLTSKSSQWDTVRSLYIS